MYGCAYEMQCQMQLQLQKHNEFSKLIRIHEGVGKMEFKNCVIGLTQKWIFCLSVRILKL